MEVILRKPYAPSLMTDWECMIRACREYVGARLLRAGNTDPDLCEYLLFRELALRKRLEHMANLMDFTDEVWLALLARGAS